MRLLVLTIGVIAFAGEAALHAQTATATLSGVIIDAQRAVVPGATVALTNSATGTVRQLTTANDGSYVFAQVAPGTYDVKIEASGFKTVIRERIQLLVATPVTLNIQLEVGQLSERVVVEGGEVRINTHDATIGNAFQSSQILQLPLEGRNVAALLSLEPGVVYIGDNSSDSRNGSVNGGKSDQGNVTLDGIDVNDQQNRFAFNSVLRVTTDSVQEFRVTTVNPNADQGSSAGAQVSLITKNGTNQFHGSAYESHRNTVTTANDYFLNKTNQPRPKLLRNVFGASLSGPFVRDKFFFFFNYEGRRDASETPQSRTVPAAHMRDGGLKYRNTAGQVVSLSPDEVKSLDPLNAGANPAVLSLFKQYPMPNDPTLGDGINILGYRFTSPIRVRYNTYITRLDYNISSTHMVFARGNLQNDKTVSAQQFPGQGASSTGLNNSKGLAIGDNMTLSPRMTNILRYGYTRQGMETSGASTQPAVTFRSISDLFPFTRSSGRITPVHNLTNDLSWVKGNHTLGFGANVRFIRNGRFNFGNSFHSAQSNSSWLIGNAAELQPKDLSPLTSVSYRDAAMALLGILGQGNARYNYTRDGSVLPMGAAVERDYAANEYEFYAQDSWRIRPNFILSFGLRYGLYSPPWETNGNQVAPNVRMGEWFELRGANADKGIPSNQAPAIAFDLAGPVNDRRGFYDWDKNNFAPRLAFAYSPKFDSGILRAITGGPDKMAIRGGASLVYSRIGGAFAVTYDSIGSFGLSTGLTNPASTLSAATAPRFTAPGVIPSVLLPAAPAVGFPTTYPALFAITFGLDDTVVTPYTTNLNLSIQRQLPHDFTFEIAYVGSISKKQMIQSDLAMPVNLRDMDSNTTYFQAAQQLISLAGTPVGAVQKIAYFENIFPGLATTVATLDAKSSYAARKFSNLNPGLAPTTQLSATQVAWYLFNQFYGPSYVNALQDIDVRCVVSCSKFGKYAFFDDQYSSLAAWRSIAPAAYHSMQLLLRKRMSAGLQFDVNYTLGKSIDWSSGVERSGAFGGGFISNPWIPGQRKSVSDFDLRHQINSNWIAQLPFGRGRSLAGGANPVLDAVIGGWQVSGIFRWSSGFPVGVINGRFWPTNWQINGLATLKNEPPETGTTKSPTPNLFTNPAQAITAFKNTVAGDSGSRNVLRGDGFFTIDLGVGKSWRMPIEGHRLQFRWETFNLTNTARFDVNSLSLTLDTAGTFGNYGAMLNSPRVMQFVLRYEF